MYIYDVYIYALLYYIHTYIYAFNYLQLNCFNDLKSFTVIYLKEIIDLIK